MRNVLFSCLVLTLPLACGCSKKMEEPTSPKKSSQNEEGTSRPHVRKPDDPRASAVPPDPASAYSLAPAPARITARASSEEIRSAAASLNRFSGAFWLVLGSDGKNSFASPWSVSIALGMTYLGARGDTAAEMARAMGYSLGQRQHAAFGTMIRSLCTRPPSKSTAPAPAGKGAHVFVVANSIWPHVSFELLAPFVSELESSYGVGVKKLDFESSPEKNAATINRWVESRTSGEIKNLLGPGDVPKMTRLVLVNTVYFKGTWATPFDRSRTHQADFHLSRDRKVSVPTMVSTSHRQYLSRPDFAAVRLPYKGRMVMDVVLPARADGIARVEKTLGAQGFALSFGPGQRVTVFLPRFKLERLYRLNQALSKLGIVKAFSSAQADFSGISPKGKDPFFIGTVIHKAVCKVDEVGTVAAAATTIAMPGGKPPGQPAVFRAEHPFLFVIRDVRTGIVLFVGRVMNPMEQSG